MFGLIDSGADSSLFPVQWASEFGVDLASCVSTVGTSAAGNTGYFRWADGLLASVAGETFRLQAMFGACPIVLLGRSDFFGHFRVIFNQQAMTFEIEPHAPMRS
jgi:hypothetical protein